jgi:hypothetical protein
MAFLEDEELLKDGEPRAISGYHDRRARRGRERYKRGPRE